ncbi:MAG TPA: C45 family peptidase [Aggregatilineales bacterium]|nr:C45 family peptidase [Aggregatilineales bacterium]
MLANTPMKMVRVSGSHREMGRQLGEACAPEIHRMLDVYRASLQTAYNELHLTWPEAMLQASKYYPFAREHTPQYVEELEGMAEAAGVAFDELMVVNCIEAITSDALHLGCTSLAVSGERTLDGHVLVAHNEDWLPEDEENAYLVHATPDDEPPFLALNYGGLLPNIGFNALGIAQACDSVYPNDARIGVPRIFVSRAVLGARQISQAIRRVIIKWRAAGYNHLIADRNGELYSVEVSARHFATIYGMEGVLAHTNHYLTARMKPYEDGTEDLISSRVRFNRAQRLLRSEPCHMPDTLKRILGDHVDYPSSICSHTDPNDDPMDRQKTIASLIMDLTELKMYACWGNPCEGTYFEYCLET